MPEIVLCPRPKEEEEMKRVDGCPPNARLLLTGGFPLSAYPIFSIKPTCPARL
jgi:hypothetical protein